jgi:hypothetical protein
MAVFFGENVPKDRSLSFHKPVMAVDAFSMLHHYSLSESSRDLQQAKM